MQKYQREHTEAANDISGYLANPINAYLLTKRLTTDWKQVENLMANDVGYGRSGIQLIPLQESEGGGVEI